LTGLVPAMYLDAEGDEIVDFPDNDKSGLYIQARNGSIHHVTLPPDAIGFQIGETSQIHSGGILQATPHAVRGSSMPNVTRESFAIFMEPEYFGAMDLPEGKTVDDVQDASIVLPSSVKTLSSRWKPGMNFGEFSDATFRAFY
jgi:isopenicillin N synthase-like dioxygenase